MSEMKSWHSLDNRSGCAVLAHVPEAQPKHDTPYLYSGHADPFGPSCLHAHSSRRVMNNLLIKKVDKYFIFTSIFESTKYDEHNI
jgi:hypothetical protein